MFRVLVHRTYRHLFAAQVVALVGTGLLTVALGLLAYDLAPGSASAVVGTALTIKIAVYTLLSPVIAALADRIPRRTLLVGADVVRGCVALALPFVDAVWQVYVLVLVLQTASAAFTPAFQAVIPTVLPDERDYTRALSLSRLAYDLEALLSPVLATLLLTVVGYHLLFTGTVLGFAASALLVVSVRLPSLVTGAGERAFGRRLGHGVAVVWRHRPLRGLLALDLVVAAATALVLVNTVELVRDVLVLGEDAVALTLAAFGAGSALVALALPRLLEHVDERRVMVPAGVVLAATLSLCVPSLATGAGRSWAVVLVLWALLGAATSAVLTPSARLLRRFSTPADRPSVFATAFALSHACFLLTYPVAGWIGSRLGLATSTGVLAGLAVAGSVAAALLWSPRVDAEVLEGAGRAH